MALAKLSTECSTDHYVWDVCTGTLANFPGQISEALGSGKIEDGLGKIQPFIRRTIKNVGNVSFLLGNMIW